jgi:hypothetical protein
VKGKKKDKERITLGLCVNADGSDKLPPVMIAKSKRPRCFGKTFDPNLILQYYSNTKAYTILWLSTLQRELNTTIQSQLKQTIPPFSRS